jgi:hypothetical protein
MKVNWQKTCCDNNFFKQKNLDVNIYIYCSYVKFVLLLGFVIAHHVKQFQEIPMRLGNYIIFGMRFKIQIIFEVCNSGMLVPKMTGFIYWEIGFLSNDA